MTDQRYKELMNPDVNPMDPDECPLHLTRAEIGEGWHFCWEFDGLLVGPGMGELAFCCCWDKTHPVYNTIPDVNKSEPIDNQGAGMGITLL